MSASRGEPPDQAGAATSAEFSVRRWTGGEAISGAESLAEEMPVAFSYQGIPHVVMLATPADLLDLGYGFTLSEAIVTRPGEIRGAEVVSLASSMEIRLDISAESFAGLVGRRRNLAARTGCGLCGAEAVEEAIRGPVKVGTGIRLSAGELHAAMATLAARQPLNALTGCVHAAAWATPGNGIEVVREDVGRHNAVDKVIGALLRSGRDPAAGFLLVTSRASYEIVQKATVAGISVVAAVSAPTAFATRLALDSGLTLAGFVRGQRHTVYAHGHRLPAGGAHGP